METIRRTAKKVILLLLLSLPTTSTAFTKTTVPVNNCHVHSTELSQSQLYGIFTLTFKFWNDGQRIQVVLLPDTTLTHREFLWEYLGLTPSRYREIIQARTSPASADAPYVVNSEWHMIQTIDKIDGSIGYIGKGTFIVSDGHNVKTIRINF